MFKIRVEYWKKTIQYIIEGYERSSLRSKTMHNIHFTYLIHIIRDFSENTNFF